MATNYYVLLGLPASASREDIRAAYRRRALELHPDRSGSGSEPFLELQQAYGTLSDPERRAAYDRAHGWEVPSSTRQTQAEPLRGHRRPAEPFRPVEAASEVQDISVLRSFHTYQPSFDELTDRLFENFGRLDRPKAEHLESLSIDIPITPDEALFGGEIDLIMPARVTCPACAGRGAVGFYLCWRCGGEGALNGEVPVRIAYPPGIRNDYVVRLPLDDLGIHNLYLTVRFRVTGEAP